jgi:hypothetical protein
MKWKLAETDSGAAQTMACTLVIALGGAVTLALMFRFKLIG